MKRQKREIISQYDAAKIDKIDAGFDVSDEENSSFFPPQSMMPGFENQYLCSELPTVSPGADLDEVFNCFKTLKSQEQHLVKFHQQRFSVVKKLLKNNRFINECELMQLSEKERRVAFDFILLMIRGGLSYPYCADCRYVFLNGILTDISLTKRFDDVRSSIINISKRYEFILSSEQFYYLIWLIFRFDYFNDLKKCCGYFNPDYWGRRYKLIIEESGVYVLPVSIAKIVHVDFLNLNKWFAFDKRELAKLVTKSFFFFVRLKQHVEDLDDEDGEMTSYDFENDGRLENKLSIVRQSFDALITVSQSIITEIRADRRSGIIGWFFKRTNKFIDLFECQILNYFNDGIDFFMQKYFRQINATLEWVRNAIQDSNFDFEKCRKIFSLLQNQANYLKDKIYYVKNLAKVQQQKRERIVEQHVESRDDYVNLPDYDALVMAVENKFAEYSVCVNGDYFRGRVGLEQAEKQLAQSSHAYLQSTLNYFSEGNAISEDDHLRLVGRLSLSEGSRAEAFYAQHIQIITNLSTYFKVLLIEMNSPRNAPFYLNYISQACRYISLVRDISVINCLRKKLAKVLVRAKNASNHELVNFIEEQRQEVGLTKNEIIRLLQEKISVQQNTIQQREEQLTALVHTSENRERLLKVLLFMRTKQICKTEEIESDSLAGVAWCGLMRDMHSESETIKLHVETIALLEQEHNDAKSAHQIYSQSDEHYWPTFSKTITQRYLPEIFAANSSKQLDD